MNEGAFINVWVLIIPLELPTKDTRVLAIRGREPRNGPVKDEKLIGPNEVKAVPVKVLTVAVTPTILTVRVPLVIGTLTSAGWAKLGSAEKVTALTAAKMEERRVVAFMFFVW